jgi:hydrogenase maturation factor
MIAQVIRQVGEAAQPAESEAVPGHAEVAENSSDSKVINVQTGVHNDTTKQDEKGAKSAQNLGKQVLLQSNTENTAMQRDPTEAQEKPQQLSRRTHGGALPR